ncbi:MAG TPA: UDP-N-acetylmuramoyl-L-alanyl-D-glutamate--2,6-diaminopimelate ligase [Acidimicrobiia bacterium]|nr:UDP-N-acetylmuramoyl-L-alanyl-D-glutamate--2,6-diaminopimelate ligase [Acidimicrobiia bacterium]
MVVEPVTLQRLAAIAAGTVVGNGAVTVDDVTHDSRAAGPGVLFVAVPGARADGHEFVPAAVAAGSPAVCITAGHTATVPAIVVTDTRGALAPLAAEVHGRPADRLRLVGVTGTNGKTTVTHIVESICTAAGIPAAVAGTVGARIRGRALPMERTTPEAPDFQRLLRAMVEAGVDVAAVEVSSHALTLGRVAATRFRVGAFTNLSQDHLDFHGDMTAYEAAKATLFASCEQAVIWIDDAAGDRIAAAAAIPVVRVGTGADAELVVRTLAADFGGSEFTLSGPGFEWRLRVPLPGDFNVANAAVAAACAWVLGIAPEAITAGVSGVSGVPGRFELVPNRRGLTVAVDYAHTPDGIAAVIAAAGRIQAGRGRVIAVVGAGGDRDRAKRPLMGAAACAADLAVLTTDNPRLERPEDILAEVVAGIMPGAEVIVELDRRRAIRRAIEAARPGDAVLILGKGHEQTQDFGNRVIPFDDRRVAAEEADRS